MDVRDYASHAVTIIGFVSAPGTKVFCVVKLYLFTRCWLKHWFYLRLHEQR